MPIHADVPQGVRRLIRERLYSVEALEVLLLLRAKPSIWWSAEDVGRQRRSPSDAALLRLRRLAGADLLACEDRARFRYAPRTTELRDAVDALAEKYRTHRVAITALIYEKDADAAARFDERIGLRGPPGNVADETK